MVVSNSSPLVYLSALNDISLLREFFGTVAIPPSVYREVVVQGSGYPVSDTVRNADWIRVEQLADRPCAIAPNVRLHAGETEAILLAQQLEADALLMDDGDGVHTARSLGLNVIRTPGIYRLAQQRGRITNIREKLDALRAVGF